MKKWMLTMKKADFTAIANRFGIDQVTARIIRNRGLEELDDIEMFLSDDHSYLHDPYLLPNIEAGARVIIESIREHKRIRVFGDYDADGICSTYILTRGIRECGGEVDYILPDRVVDGYGLSDGLVDKAHADGIDTIITCDNGIAASSQILRAKGYGMKVVVTDHHEVPFEIDDQDRKIQIIPPADSVIDPKMEISNYPYEEICGAVVAFKFIQVLFDLCGKSPWQHDGGAGSDFFEDAIIFAGIATVCDVMPLLDENRIIVKRSLMSIKRSTNIGLNALIEAADLDQDSINSYHYGFVIGPCMNASGRMDNAMRALDLFMSTDKSSAMIAAVDLKELNDSRKNQTQIGYSRACEYVDSQESLPKVLVIYLSDCMESIAGIIAGKIRERYSRPTLVITDAHDGELKGSGRSTEQYDMFEELSRCKHLFTKFGGHKMAAGFSLLRSDLDQLRKELNDNCQLSDDDFYEINHIDVPMPIGYATLALAEQFSVLEPFGNGNPKPLFACKNVRITEGRTMGKTGQFGKYKIQTDDGRLLEMVNFGNIDDFNQYIDEKYGSGVSSKLYGYGEKPDIRLDLCYTIGINSFRGNESLQVILQDYQ